jgi:hypothetical protein
VFRKVFMFVGSCEIQLSPKVTSVRSLSVCADVGLVQKVL